MENEQGILKKRDELQQYVTKGIKRIDSGSLDGSHLLGVATQSISSFETLVRELLHLYLSFCRVDYDQALRPLVKGKDFDRLTLGEVILGFRTLNSTFATCTAFLSDKSIPARRNLIDAKLSRSLDRITMIRKRLHQDKPMPAAEARELLSLVSTSLEHLLFEVGGMQL